MNVRDIRHEIHRVEHENVGDGDDDARDGRAPLALRDDFAGVGAEGRREGDDRPEDRRQDDAADGIDRHGADVRLDLWDELRDDLLGLAVENRVSCCAAGYKQDEQHLLSQVVLDAEVGELVQRHAEAADENSEHADDGRRRQRFAPTENLRDDDDEQNGQGALDGIGRGHVEMAVCPHEAEAVACVRGDAGEKEDPETRRHLEDRDGRPENDVRPHDGACHAKACVEDDGHVVFLGDEIPRGVEHGGGENQKKGKE